MANLRQALLEGHDPDDIESAICRYAYDLSQSKKNQNDRTYPIGMQKFFGPSIDAPYREYLKPTYAPPARTAQTQQEVASTQAPPIRNARSPEEMLERFGLKNFGASEVFKSGNRRRPVQSDIEEYGLYDGRPPHVAGSDTSESAAEAIADCQPKLVEEVYRFLRRRQTLGATCDDVEVALDMKHQTASARLRELAQEERIVDSGRRGKTRSGRSAVIWIVKE